MLPPLQYLARGHWAVLLGNRNNSGLRPLPEAIYDPADQSFRLAISVLLAAGVIAALFTACLMIFYERRRRSKLPSVRLLDELSGAHGLTRRQRRLLQQIALQAELDQPALLAIVPQSFDQAVAVAKLTVRDRRDVARAREKFFDDTQPA